MKVIEYRVQYTGAVNKNDGKGFVDDGSRSPEYEVITVEARDINSGYGAALKIAKQPLGSGARREIGRIEFWQVAS